MSCSDILLSFLADVGDDWNDSFIFPTDASIDVTDYLNKSDYLPEICDDSMESTDCTASPASSYEEPSSSEDREFMNAIDSFGDNDDGYFPFDEEVIVSSSFLAMPEPEQKQPPECKKRKADERPSVTKRSKFSTDIKIRGVCALLAQYKLKQEAIQAAEKIAPAKQIKFTNSIDVAENYLKTIIGSTSAATPAELLKHSSPSSSFFCKALGSLHTEAQKQKVQLKLAAWCPSPSTAFPDNHTGVGQVAAASRAFNNALNDILSANLVQKLQYSVQVVREDAIVSKYGEQLSAPFIWRSVGMVAMGFPEELEFTGLIRCTFCKEGVSAASVSFDAFTVVRQSQAMFAPVQSVAGVL